jgi:hypothetical protein
MSQHWRRSGQKKDKVKLRKPSILIDPFLSFTLSFFLMYFFCRFLKNFTLFMTKIKVLVLSFVDFAVNFDDSGYINTIR